MNKSLDKIHDMQSLLTQLIINYIDYKDMMNFLLAFLSSKHSIPKYCIKQVKKKFVLKYGNKYGFFYAFPNNIIDGYYKCTYEEAVYEGVFINDQRYYKSNQTYIKVRNDDPTHHDYDISCRNKPFGYYIDQYTRTVNRLVCGGLYGYINTVSSNRRWLIRGHNSYDNQKRAMISYSEIIVNVRHKDEMITYRYNIDGRILSRISHNTTHQMHGISVWFNTNENICAIAEFDNGNMIIREAYSSGFIDGQTTRITVRVGASRRAYVYRRDVGYVDRFGTKLDREPYINTIDVDAIKLDCKIDPSFIPNSNEINMLKNFIKTE
jgi:hypothetical protein